MGPGTGPGPAGGTGPAGGDGDGSTGVAVLAAGAGSRFAGGPKLLAPLRGRPLLAWALDAALAAGVGPTAVVLGGAAGPVRRLVPAGVAVVVNHRRAGGLASSLAAAVAWARHEGLSALVVGLGDQPLVRPEAWRAVAAADAPVAAAAYGGRRGHPVRLHRDVWDRLPTSGDEGARALLRDHPELGGLVPCPGSDEDVDTVADLARLATGPGPHGTGRA